MFKQLKSLFIQDEEKTADKNAAEEQKAEEKPAEAETAPESAAPAAENVPEDVPAAPPAAGKPSTKFLDVLFGAMEKNNIEGYDYLEFKKSLKSLNEVGTMDEATLFKSAFAAAQPLGLSKAKLLETANFYLNILQKEEERFDVALKNQRSKQIGSREDHINKLGDLIGQKQKQIEQLQKEIEVNQKEMDKLKAEISNSTSKVEGTKRNFVASYNFIVSQIKGDIENINRYLS